MIAIERAYKWCEENQADPNLVFSNSQLLVTVEPCIMCTMALRYLHILICILMLNTLYFDSNDTPLLSIIT